jgi:tetratricopeptide (TPR) repeat protein
LQEFQKGVRQSLEEKDFDTHYDLGIAYKDMDLLEEAIEEFKLASKDPSLALNSSQLIGLCYVRMGDVNSAIEEFLKGLSIPNQLPEQYRGLKYELALAYEAAENLKNALDLFSDIFQEDPNFREVGAKVKRLNMPRSQSSEKGKEGPVAEGPESREEKKPAEEKAPPSPKPRQRKIDYI